MVSINLRDERINAFENNPELHQTQVLNTNEPALIIKIARKYRARMTDVELYENTRRYWRAGDRIQRVRYVIAVYKEVCIEVYEVHDWRRAPHDGQWRRVSPGGDTRWEFDGVVANNDIRSQLLFKSVKHFFGRGAAYPIRYLNC